MNLWKKGKKSALALAVALALSVGTALAMPTGGDVKAGDVTGIVNGTVASGGTINVNSNALIDWNNFSVRQNEALNFAFNGSGLTAINHVTGGITSELMGTLTGANGHVMIINPSGIVVGSGAVIDVGSLTLSTLEATDDSLKNLLNSTGDIIFLASDTSNVDTALANYGVIQIADGVTLRAADSLTLQGSNVNVTDSNLTANKIRLYAGDSIEGNGDLSLKFSADSPNYSITIKNSYLTAQDTDNPSGSSIYAYGGTINLDNATLSGDILRLNALKSRSSSYPNISHEAAADYNLNITDSTLNAGSYLRLRGGSVDIAGSNATGGSVELTAYNTATEFNSGTPVADESNTISVVKGSVISSVHDVEMVAGTDIGVSDSSKITAGEGHNVIFTPGKVVVPDPNEGNPTTPEEVKTAIEAIQNHTNLTPQEQERQIASLMRKYEPTAEANEEIGGRLDAAVNDGQNMPGMTPAASEPRSLNEGEGTPTITVAEGDNEDKQEQER
ncbi:MAG: filamentous hemagglutinin N-terminal domain-containing protein [Selenomonadaceae bacterium]|nr:filamentous hemagglutinin N-terminal domain-containing protein [Selenomonadaceae bacterium]